jgi:transcriptional regulator with XRE-family HTH domain
MGIRNRPARRTPLQVAADDASALLMTRLGKMLLDGRKRARLTQARAAARAGISRTEWSRLERGKKVATLPILGRAAASVGGSLHAYISETSAADQPRDAVHLRHQELILRIGRGGGWQGLPEEQLDRQAQTSRAADVLFHRRSSHDGVGEYALWEVWDWFADVGATVRDFGRRLDAVDRYAVARMQEGDRVPRTGGCIVVRATTRNRRLIANHANFFRSRFPASSAAWLAALKRADAPQPSQPALIWVSVDGTRLFALRWRW